jgi:hypothetical protein
MHETSKQKKSKVQEPLGYSQNNLLFEAFFLPF